MADDFLGGVEIEGFRGVEVVVAAPVKDGGPESEVGDDGGEIGAAAAVESGVEGEGNAGEDAVALECVAGGDDEGIRHDRAGQRAEELNRNWKRSLLVLDRTLVALERRLRRRRGIGWRFEEGDLPPLLAAPH